MMLDVNAAIVGNVEHAFTPYHHDINMSVFRTFCERYAIDISTEDAVALMRHFEGFACAR